MAAAERANPRWLFGPAPDLLLGCGLLYVLLFAAHALFAPTLREATPSYLLPMGILLLSAPHYGGTLLRVYEQRRDRRSYAIFSIWFTLALLALFFVALPNPWLGSLLFTLYLTWSPWHYSGQNYGLAVMFLRRRGVNLDAGAKRWLYASFVLSFAIAALVMHLEVGTAYSPVEYEGEIVTLLPIGFSRAFGDIVLPIVGSAYLLCLVVAALLLRRRGSWSDLLPTGVLALTQALWFAAPFSVHYWGWQTGIEPLDAQQAIATYTMLIFIGHGVQYLWVTTYYARAGGAWQGYGLYWLKVAAAGIAIWQLPQLLLEPGSDARGIGWFGSVGLLVATFVNLHHFVLDGAIWKLRNSRIAGVLIRDGAEAGGDEAPAPTSRWMRRAVWSAAGIGMLAGALSFGLTRIALPAAIDGGDLERAARWAEVSRRLGTDEPAVREALAIGLRKRGELDHAQRQAQRLVRLRGSGKDFALLGRIETARGNAEPARVALERALQEGGVRSDEVHSALGTLAMRRDDEAAAIDHFRAALEQRPTSHAIANTLAWLLAEASDPELRDPDAALRLAEAVVGEFPEPNYLDTLAAAQAANGRLDDALATAVRAEALARERGDPALAAIQDHLSRLRARAGRGQRNSGR